MTLLARHAILDYYECPEEVLDDIPFIEKAMVGAAEFMGATVVASKFHQFSPYGVSGTVVIAESHLTVHTWPEHGYAAVDVFTCGETVDPWISCNYLKEKFSAENMTAREIKRGIFDYNVQHKPAVNY